jgi:hypothetical protein
MQPQQPYYGPPASPQPQQPNYDFIVNPGKPPKHLPTAGGSKLSRILIVGGGLILLIIVFSIGKGLLSGGGNQAALALVVADQQEIIHLSTAATQQPNISSTNQNFAITGKLVVTSEQTQLLKYMAQQKQKVSDKQLRLKVSAAVDKQLLGAVASSTYDQTFQEVMKSLLTDYATALQVAYKQSSGANARKLLKAEYNSAQLLQRQLATPSS